MLLTAGYNGDGLRAWKESGGVRRYFLYDGELLICELDASGNVLTTNTWGASGLIARNQVWYQFDLQGSVAHRLDASGKVLSSDLYDANGNLLAGGDNSDPYGYNGEWAYYTDHENSLILCTNRYYDSSSSRFVTCDPIGFDGGANFYAYTSNNPIQNIDPTGLKFRWPWSPEPRDRYAKYNCLDNAHDSGSTAIGQGFGDKLPIGSGTGMSVIVHADELGRGALALAGEQCRNRSYLSQNNTDPQYWTFDSSNQDARQVATNTYNNSIPPCKRPKPFNPPVPKNSGSNNFWWWFFHELF